MPTNSSGHHPHGGSESVMSAPVPRHAASDREPTADRACDAGAPKHWPRVRRCARSSPPPSDRDRAHVREVDDEAEPGRPRRVAREDRRRLVRRLLHDVHPRRRHDLVAGERVGVPARADREDDLVAGAHLSMWRNGRLCVTRWPATTTLPSWLGSAVPGQWPGPLFSVVRVMPSKSTWLRPTFGISIVPMRFSGSGACALRGDRAGVGSGAAVVGGRRRRRDRGRGRGRRGRRRRGGGRRVEVVGASVAGAASVGSSSTSDRPPHAATTSAPAPATRKVRRSMGPIFTRARHLSWSRASKVCAAAWPCRMQAGMPRPR